MTNRCPCLLRQIILLNLGIVATLALFACNSKPSSPTSPTPTATTSTTTPPPTPTALVVSGRAVDLQSGAPVAGAAVVLDGFGPVMTDGVGAFQVPVPSATTRITLARDGYFVRTSYLPGGVARDIGDVSLINTAPPFDLVLYLQIVRGTIGGGLPTNNDRITRITVPDLTLVIVDRTINVGAPVNESILARTVDMVREFTQLWTGGRVGINGVRRVSVAPDGIERQLNRYLTVSFHSGNVPGFTAAGVCGSGGNNGNSGSIDISLTGCGDLQTQLPGVIAHELGHALLGLRHVDPARYPGLAMNTIHQSLRPTTTELYYANIVMNRPNDNIHPDNDCRYLTEVINGIPTRVC